MLGLYSNFHPFDWIKNQFQGRGPIGVVLLLILLISVILGILLFLGWQSRYTSNLLRESHFLSIKIEDQETYIAQLKVQKNTLSNRARIEQFARNHGLTSKGDSVQIPVLLEVSE